MYLVIRAKRKQFFVLGFKMVKDIYINVITYAIILSLN
jgi:hypothetical protein